MTDVYCNNCKQNVGTKPILSALHIVILFTLILLGGLPGLIYIIYAMKAKKFKACAICKGKNLDVFKTKIDDA